MTIRNKLTLLLTTILAVLLLAFISFIYFSFSENREDEYYRILRHTAITKANLLLDAKVAPQVLQLIYHHAENTLFQEEVAIYDTAFNLLYHDGAEIDKVKETRQMIAEIVQKKEIKFYQGTVQVVGFLFLHNNKEYVLTGAAADEYGYLKMLNLRFTLFIAFSIAIVFIFLSSRLIANKALKPVADMIVKVKDITATNLDLRINTGNSKDEISELAITFNAMLDRLEKSFDAQQDFVSNISHELRTPLTAMMAELQLTYNNQGSNEAYKQSISHAIGDAKKIVRLSNSLLDLAKANYDPSAITFKQVRLDEILLDARQYVKHNYSDYKVNILFEKEIEDDDFISIRGNEYLLKVAFSNLIENGCKFSESKEVAVAITYYKDKTILRFQDFGIGMGENEILKIFAAFYRGENKKYAGGNGIGLSLAKKIIDLHKGTIDVISKINEGSTFTVEFPHL